MLHKLIFDTTDTDSINQSANVGAYLRSADGTLLTHTDVSGKKALDVRVAEGINVEVDLSHVDDSVRIGDGTDFLEINADGSINAVVSATNLDIRDLTAASDSVAAWTKDGAGNPITSTTGFLDVNIGSSIPLTVSDSALANTAIQANAASVSVTGALFSSPLASRKYAFVYNNGSKTIFVGQSGVSIATGFPVFPGSMLEMRAGAAVAVHAVAFSGTQEARLLQLS